MNAAGNDREILQEGRPVDEWRIGFILIRSGRLKKEDVVKIIQLQRQNGMRFGDAAIELGVLAEGDIRFALARQFDYPYVTHGESKISKDVVAAYQPDSAAAESLRALRSQLMVRWFDSDQGLHKALAIAGPDRGVGRSWLAANLAVTFSQLGKNTVLVDGDLRNSIQHKFFGLDNREGLSEILCGRTLVSEALRRNQILPNLALITAGATPPNPQEVIARDGFRLLLESLRATADVIIVDTPADSQATDGQIIIKHTGGAMIMARRHLSRVRSLNSYISALRATGAALPVSVLVD